MGHLAQAVGLLSEAPHINDFAAHSGSIRTKDMEQVDSRAVRTNWKGRWAEQSMVAAHTYCWLHILWGVIPVVTSSSCVRWAAETQHAKNSGLEDEGPVVHGMELLVLTSNPGLFMAGGKRCLMLFSLEERRKKASLQPSALFRKIGPHRLGGSLSPCWAQMLGTLWQVLCCLEGEPCSHVNGSRGGQAAQTHMARTGAGGRRPQVPKVAGTRIPWKAAEPKAV